MSQIYSFWRRLWPTRMETARPIDWVIIAVLVVVAIGVWR